MKIDLNKSLLLKLGIVATLIIMGIFVFMKSEDNFTGLAIQNPIKTCKQVEVPYEVQEAYEEQEPYQALEEYQVPLKYEADGYKDATTHGFDYWARSTIKVRNVDSETGQFTVQQWFKTKDGESQKFSSSQYIMPGETKEFVQEYDIDQGYTFEPENFFDSYHNVFPPQKTLTRTVTKYKTVTKYRTVTNYKMEEKCE
ncbi:MAG: hypothetical protein AABX05_05670 [Nanoarchaeota archaeon]